MRRKISIMILVLAVPLCAFAVFGDDRIDDFAASLIRKIPVRGRSSITGSEFTLRIAPLGKREREEAILRELREGNLPDFLRRLKPVTFHHRLSDGRNARLTIFVMPDYLSVGSDRDYILVPMGLHTALAVADSFGFILPTKKIVDAIFSQSMYHLKPQPLPAGPQMRSTAYYRTHNRKIEEQRLALCCAPGELISGHKKDVVLTNRLIHREGKIAIYGWHFPSGNPIQPLSTWHGAEYADYSHGVRLVSDTVLQDGTPRSIYDVLGNPALAEILSDEGAMPRARDLMTRYRRAPGGLASVISGKAVP